MSQTGPITKDTSTLALGLAKIRIGVSNKYISSKAICMSGEADSIGSLANTKFTGSTDWYKPLSGFPQLEDYVIALKDSAALECALEEITPFNFALAMGVDAATAALSGEYPSVHSGEISLGGRTSPDFVRMEAQYTFPNGSNTMTIIFPKAQAVSNIEVSLEKEAPANIPVTFEAKRADTMCYMDIMPSWGSSVQVSRPT